MECVLCLQPALASHWKIWINAQKTKVITFKRTPSGQINLAINGDPKNEVFSHCHLGVHLQQDLKWNVQD